MDKEPTSSSRSASATSNIWRRPCSLSRQHSRSAATIGFVGRGKWRWDAPRKSGSQQIRHWLARAQLSCLMRFSGELIHINSARRKPYHKVLGGRGRISSL